MEIHLSVGHYTAILHSSERLVLTWFFLSLFKCYWNRVYGRHRSYLIGNAILLCIMWIIWCEREFILLRGMSFLWRSWKRYSLRCLHEWTVMGSLPSFSFPDCWFVKLSSVLFKRIFSIHSHIYLWLRPLHSFFLVKIFLIQYPARKWGNFYRILHKHMHIIIVF